MHIKSFLGGRPAHGQEMDACGNATGRQSAASGPHDNQTETLPIQLEQDGRKYSAEGHNNTTQQTYQLETDYIVFFCAHNGWTSTNNFRNFLDVLNIRIEWIPSLQLIIRNHKIHLINMYVYNKK